MEIIGNFLQQGIEYAIPFIILLGILIFVHELGHFLVAKFYGVRVEVFSLGFGKKIFQFRHGDTVYCISLIPLGGYVKMFGDDPSAEVEPELQKYAFLKKPVMQRIAIVLAGPLMNFFFAILVFAGVAFLGEKALAPIFGDIATNSEAYEAGFRSGEKIVSINGVSVEKWDDFKSVVETSAEKQIVVEVEDSQGKARQVKAIPQWGENTNVLSSDDQVGIIEGASFASRSPHIGIADPTSPAAVAGLQTGDMILEFNGTSVSYWRELENLVNSNLEKQQISLKVQRVIDKKPVEKAFEIIVPSNLKPNKGFAALTKMGIEKTDLFLAKVVDDSPAQRAGLRKNDRIVSVNGKVLQNWQDLVAQVKSFKGGGPPLDVTVLREGISREEKITPKMTVVQGPGGAKQERYTIGIQPWIIQTRPESVTIRTPNPLKALWAGTVNSWKWSEMTLLTFVRIFQNRISANNIGGVISIAVVAKQTFEIGISEFLTIMGIISINLFILNLLPIPILDGGHLVFFSIEALRGAPLSLRKLEIAQQVGLFLILMLIVFAVINDISRFVNF